MKATFRWMILAALGLAGCVTLPAKVPDSRPAGSVAVQEGEVALRKDLVKIKYDVPFTAPPLLEFTANGYVVKVVEQRKDGFNIALRGEYDPPYTVKWRARAKEQP